MTSANSTPTRPQTFPSSSTIIHAQIIYSLSLLPSCRLDPFDFVEHMAYAYNYSEVDPKSESDDDESSDSQL